MIKPNVYVYLHTIFIPDRINDGVVFMPSGENSPSARLSYEAFYLAISSSVFFYESNINTVITIIQDTDYFDNKQYRVFQH